MRRADRLFQIIQYLRRKKTATAQDLAEALQVSVRTIYRDIQDLVLSQVPILGEAGVGYRIAKGFDIPPMMFRPLELEALVLGARMVMAWADEELAKEADKALSKIEEVLPLPLRDRIAATTLFAPEFHISKKSKSWIAPLRDAIARRNFVLIEYKSSKQIESSRQIRPLGLLYWGTGWSLVAFCEARQDFRHFRLDRIRTLQVSQTQFSFDPKKALTHFLT